MAETRLGIIGLGGFGLFCLDKCRLIPGVRISAIADINAAALDMLGSEYHIPLVTKDWRELIASPDVDVVHIITPPSEHAPMALAAIAAGKHVFVEKPLAITIEDADAILAAAERQGVRVGIDFVMRYNPLYDLVRTITEEGLLGRMQWFLFQNEARDLPATHWFWDPRLSGGIPVEHGVHFFDIFTSLLGPGSIRWAERSCRASGVEDKWMMMLAYNKQVFGTFYHAFDKPEMIEQTRAELEFAHGRITLEGWIPDRLSLEAVGDTATVQRLAELLPAAEITSLGDGPVAILAEGEASTASQRISAIVSAGEKQELYGRAVRNAMADFIAWTHDPTHRPLVTGEDGRHALQTALDVTRLARDTSGPCGAG
ncbi:MAG TPA: Gfo/Idh/MocA family oxidoreductase [Armatimonadota bacterium]|jgi:predicted dehydrogenase